MLSPTSTAPLLRELGVPDTDKELARACEHVLEHLLLTGYTPLASLRLLVSFVTRRTGTAPAHALPRDAAGWAKLEAHLTPWAADRRLGEMYRRSVYLQLSSAGDTFAEMDRQAKACAAECSLLACTSATLAGHAFSSGDATGCTPNAVQQQPQQKQFLLQFYTGLPGLPLHQSMVGQLLEDAWGEGTALFRVPTDRDDDDRQVTLTATPTLTLIQP